MLEPSRPLKRPLDSSNAEDISKPEKKFKNIPSTTSQVPAPNISELPPIKVHQKETVSLETQLEPETIEAFASIDHFLPAKEYCEVLLKLKLDSNFNESVALYEETYSKSKTNFSIPTLSNIYKSANQERYSTLMKAYTEMGTFLKSKLDWNFYQTLTFFSCARHCMEVTLTPRYYNGPEDEAAWVGQGFPRSEPGETKLTPPYDGLADFYAEKQKVSDGEIFFDYISQDYNNEEISLTRAFALPTGVLHVCFVLHTAADNIEKGLKHVDFLYKKVKSSTNKEEITNLSGKIFWWICQIKPWNYGDPSIAEMFFRSIWSEKGIPNDPWISSVIPWCETLKEFDVEKFGENFDKLFDRPTVNKVEIATDDFFIGNV